MTPTLDFIQTRRAITIVVTVLIVTGLCLTYIFRDEIDQIENSSLSLNSPAVQASEISVKEPIRAYAPGFQERNQEVTVTTIAYSGPFLIVHVTGDDGDRARVWFKLKSDGPTIQLADHARTFWLGEEHREAPIFEVGDRCKTSATGHRLGLTLIQKNSPPTDSNS